MISAFGRRAEQIRDLLPADIDAVVFDEDGLDEAARESGLRHERGEWHYAMAVIDDARVRVSRAIASQINDAVSDLEQRYYMTEQLGSGVLVDGAGIPIAESWAKEEEPLRRAVVRALSNADALLVRSYAEYAAICLWSEVWRSRSYRRVTLADTVPEFERAEGCRPSVVVWSGRRTTADATLALLGLEEFRGDVAYVGDAPIPNIGARFIARGDPALRDALAVAGCVVCVDPADPADAVAFARRLVPVVAPVTSAAYEFVDGVVSWDAADASRLGIATSFALGRVVTGTAPDRIEARPPATPLPAGPERLPLVSVLTATYNRREHLRRMLTCIAAQTYPNVESIVVNDAGEPVDDIVAEFPFARLINAERNCGTFFRASRLGLAQARGEYIAMLPDDDWFYPDHIERLMAVILRCGAAVAHGFAVLRFLRDVNGTEQTYALNTTAYSSTVNPTAALLGTPVAMHQCLQRRDTFAVDDAGWPLLDAVGGDQEYHMRLLERYQLVAVDRFTCEFRDHAGNLGKTNSWAEAMEYIYETVRPEPDRPVTARLRRQKVEYLRTVPVGRITYVPNILLPLEESG